MKNSSFGYEMKAKGMKQMYKGMKNMTNVTKTAHLGKKEVFVWTPELVATVGATLAGTVTKHVGVKQGGGQEAEAGDGEEGKGSADNCKRR